MSDGRADAEREQACLPRADAAHAAAEAERQAKEEQERIAKAEAERQAKEEQERIAKAEAKADAERRSKEQQRNKTDAMKTGSPRLRFVLALALFLFWVGILAYLALSTADPTVLSRPQFLVSTLDVIATVEEADGQPRARVKIVSVHWPANRQELVNQDIVVPNLPTTTGWRGPGQYILPLIEKDRVYAVAPLPRSPGFSGSNRSINPPRIYLLTEETRSQLESIGKPE